MLYHSAVTQGRRKGLQSRDVEETAFNWGSGSAFISADPPQPRLKGASITCQAKRPELLIDEINTDRVFLPDPGKFQCQLEGYLVVIEEHATIS
jgi:hypothetical protein